MRLIVVSESMNHVRRDESYSSPAGPAIPAGVMHGAPADQVETLCGRELPADWHVWPDLTFPRTFGRHCPECVDQEARREHERLSQSALRSSTSDE